MKGDLSPFKRAIARDKSEFPFPICYNTGHKLYTQTCIFTVWSMQKSTLSTQLSTETGEKPPVLSGFFGFFHTHAICAYNLSTDFGLSMSHFQPIQGLFMTICALPLQFNVILTGFYPISFQFNPDIIISFLFVYCISIAYLCQFHAFTCCIFIGLNCSPLSDILN